MGLVPYLELLVSEHRYRAPNIPNPNKLSDHAKSLDFVRFFLRARVWTDHFVC